MRLTWLLILLSFAHADAQRPPSAPVDPTAFPAPGVRGPLVTSDQWPRATTCEPFPLTKTFSRTFTRPVPRTSFDCRTIHPSRVSQLKARHGMVLTLTTR